MLIATLRKVFGKFSKFSPNPNSLQSTFSRISAQFSEFYEFAELRLEPKERLLLRDRAGAPYTEGLRNPFCAGCKEAVGVW